MTSCLLQSHLLLQIPFPQIADSSLLIPQQNPRIDGNGPLGPQSRGGRIGAATSGASTNHLPRIGPRYPPHRTIPNGRPRAFPGDRKIN
jgi:hypothetical protein